MNNRDLEHLRLLAIFHYVVAALGALFACLPLLHVGLGVVMVVSPEALGGSEDGAAPPGWLGYFFILLGGVFVLIGWAAAICTFISGRFLATRQRRMFSLVMAALLCAFFPFGTVLGIFTIVVLSRESVRQLYEEGEEAASAAQSGRPVD